MAGTELIDNLKIPLGLKVKAKDGKFYWFIEEHNEWEQIREELYNELRRHMSGSYFEHKR